MCPRAVPPKKSFYFDLCAALPYHEMPPAKRARIWYPDGIHLTEEGYDYVGEKIAEALTRIVRLAEAQDTDIRNSAPGPADARRPHQSHQSHQSQQQQQQQQRALRQARFEEEMGDQKLLSQGYIVVRRTDLD